MQSSLAPRSTERAQCARKVSGRPSGPQSCRIAVIDGLVEAIVALVGTERFEAEHERGEAQIILARRANRAQYARRRLTRTQYLEAAHALDLADAALVRALHDHRVRLAQKTIPETQAMYRAAEALA